METPPTPKHSLPHLDVMIGDNKLCLISEWAGLRNIIVSCSYLAERPLLI